MSVVRSGLCEHDLGGARVEVTTDLVRHGLLVAQHHQVRGLLRAGQRDHPLVGRHAVVERGAPDRDFPRRNDIGGHHARHRRHDPGCRAPSLLGRPGDRRDDVLGQRTRPGQERKCAVRELTGHPQRLRPHRRHNHRQRRTTRHRRRHRSTRHQTSPPPRRRNRFPPRPATRSGTPSTATPAGRAAHRTPAPRTPWPQTEAERPPAAECGTMSARPDSLERSGPQQWDCLCWFRLCYGHESRSGFAAK